MLTRNERGQFLPGNPGGPGRPKRAAEIEYLRAMSEAITVEDWQAIVVKAVEQARAGDAKAREWLAHYLLGDRVSLAVLSILSRFNR